MSKRFLFLLVFLLLCVLSLGSAGLYFYLSRPTWQTYQNDELKVKLDWPDNFQTVALTEPDEESGIVFKIERAKPEAQVFLRHEADLGPIRFTGKTILEYLIETIDRTYPNRFPDYRKEDQRMLVLAGQNATEFVFTYSGKDKKGKEIRIKQRYLLIVKDEENIAFFLSCQAPEKNFPQSQKDFERIISSFTFFDKVL